MAHKIITKAEALKRGLKTYDGEPCKRGHDGRRFTKGGKCAECTLEATRKIREARKAKTGKTTKSKAVAPVVVPVTPINSEPISGEVISGDWRAYAQRIAVAGQKTTESILETGALLLEAKDKVERGEFEEMIERELPFGPRAARMLMDIARNPILSNRNHGSVLPPSWRTLYELTKLPEPVLLARIEDHSIHPGMERRDVAVLAGHRHSERQEREPSDLTEKDGLVVRKFSEKTRAEIAANLRGALAETATSAEPGAATDTESVEVTPPPTAVATEPEERDHLGRTDDDARWIENHLMRSVHEILVGGFADRPPEELAMMIEESDLHLIEKVAAFLTKLADAMRRKAEAA